MRLLVVGAGVGGSMVARTARAGGIDVTVAAHPAYRAASEAALCVVCPQWWSGPMRRVAESAVDVYAELGAITATHATYTRYDRPGYVERPGFYAVDPARVLVEPDTEMEWPVASSGFDATVLCLGAYGTSPGQRTWGVTTLVRGGEDGLRGRLNRPRDVSFAANHDGITTRFGSSVAPDERRAYERQFRAERAVGEWLPSGDTDHVAGMRLMPVGQPGNIRQVGKRKWSLDGFGRVGFSVAPRRAVEVLAAISG